MANIANKFSENVPGHFYVDHQCIDCDLCRQTAPRIFRRAYSGGASHSYVAQQPASARDRALAKETLQACPVGAIGCTATETFEEVDSTASLGLMNAMAY